MRLATWNVNSLKARLPRVEAWLADVEPDVVCLQETKLADAAFPAMTFSALGYESVHHGEGRWNGVAILSRVGLEDPMFGFGPGDDDPEARLVWATCGGVRVASAYVPNGRALDHDHYRYKLAWLARLRDTLAATADPAEPVVVAGDFNIAPTDDDVYDPKAFVDATHTSPAERAALAELEAWGLADVFRRLQPEPALYSWWDYRAGNFHKHKGMRIDLVLASPPVAERATFATIDRNARKGESPSDHAPVIVDLADAAGAPSWSVRDALDRGEAAPLVEASMAAARELGVTSTPAWVLDTGFVIPGALDRATLDRWVSRILARAAPSA